MHHSEQDLMTGLVILSTGDRRRLLRYAATLIRGTPWSSAEELLAEAWETTYFGTRNAGGRRWKKGITLTRHLAVTMRGLVLDWFRYACRFRVLPQDGGGWELGDPGDEGPPMNVYAVPGLFIPSVEDQLIVEQDEQASERFRSDACSRLLAFFADDEAAHQILQGRLAGRRSGEIRAQSGLTDRLAYQAAQKRIRRALTRMKELLREDA